MSSAEQNTSSNIFHKDLELQKLHFSMTYDEVLQIRGSKWSAFHNKKMKPIFEATDSKAELKTG